jgi:hypothetical protein
MVAPGLLDRLAARGAWDQQMTAAPANPNRPDNLFEPPPGDPGAHGRFDARTVGGLHSISSGAARSSRFALAVAAASGMYFLSRRSARRDRLL